MLDAAIDCDGDIWVKKPDDEMWTCVTTVTSRSTDVDLNKEYGPISYTELVESD